MTKMKLFPKLILVLSGILLCYNLTAQSDPTIQLLTMNEGVVGVGQTVFLQVTVGNALATPVPANKIRVSISAPPSVTLDNATTQLPAGFVICSNSGGTMIISNGSTPITQSSPQTIMVAMIGTTEAPSQTVSGSMLAAGGSVGGRCNNGPPVPGNTTPNDNSTSTVTVTSTTPLTLTEFTGALVNCKPILKWKTENEINSDRFEVERSDATNGAWKGLGAVTANAISSSTKTTYNFADANLIATSARVFYRLKIIDKDGSYKYSNVLPVFVNCKTVQVNVYPNPVQDGKLYVSLTGTSGITEAFLMSITGQVISKNKLTNGTNYVDVTNVANGSYVLSVRDENGVDKKVKVLIQK